MAAAVLAVRLQPSLTRACVRAVSAVSRRVLDRPAHELEWGPRGKLSLLVTALPEEEDSRSPQEPPAEPEAPGKRRGGGRRSLGCPVRRDGRLSPAAPLLPAGASRARRALLRLRGWKKGETFQPVTFPV